MMIMMMMPPKGCGPAGGHAWRDGGCGWSGAAGRHRHTHVTNICLATGALSAQPPLRCGSARCAPRWGSVHAQGGTASELSRPLGGCQGRTCTMIVHEHVFMDNHQCVTFQRCYLYLQRPNFVAPCAPKAPCRMVLCNVACAPSSTCALVAPEVAPFPCLGHPAVSVTVKLRPLMTYKGDITTLEGSRRPCGTQAVHCRKVSAVEPATGEAFKHQELRLAGSARLWCKPDPSFP